MNKILIFLSVLFIGCLESSCTKTEDFEPLPEDKILTYKIVNLPNDEVIYGSIDNQANVIKVYLPYYLGLFVIDPEITLSPGATLEGEIEPVNVNSEDKTYTVRAANGTSRTYKLEISPQNPSSLTVSWSNPEELEGDFGPGNAFPFMVGDFRQTNIALVQIELISQKDSKVRFPMNLSTANLVPISGGNLYQMEHFSFDWEHRIPADITEGVYDVVVTTLGNSVKMDLPIKIKYRQPSVYTPFLLIQLSRKDTWDIIAHPEALLGLKKVTATFDGKEYDMPIKKWNRVEMTIGFPSDFPLGLLEGVTMRFDFEGWESVERYVYLEMSE